MNLATAISRSKKLILIILLLANISVFAQLTYVPDDNFEQALIYLGYDTGPLDDYVPTANISGVIDLDISFLSINDLTGIEDFTALTSLSCQDNQLTNLDVSGNTALTVLDCYDNQLTSLNVSGNTALTHLHCRFNLLTSLDLSANTALDWLYCSDNQLTSLELLTNTALTFLSCSSNPLTSLDVSANMALTELYCTFNQLTSLDVSANTALTGLKCGYNQLTSLDVSANTALELLWCGSNQLTTLDLSANTALTELYCPFNQLTSLDVIKRNNANITYFDATSNPNLTCIYVDDKDAAYLSGWSIDPFSTFVETEAECFDLHTYVPDDNFEQALIDLGLDSGPLDDYVPTVNISGITYFSVYNQDISNLTGIEDFAALSYLDCSNNDLTSLDLSANTDLTQLYCLSNQLTSLDMSANTYLEQLSCNDNQLTNLDVSANTALYFLWCNENQLTSLDVSANTALEWLWCNENQLTSLDVSANTDLNNLHCSLNELTSLDVSANTALTYLYCEDNQLTSLDLSANTALNLLFCEDNQLTSLDLSANTALTDLYCPFNQLTSLDVRNSYNANITYFDATSNPNLTCIYVDDKDAAYLSGWSIDPFSTFVETEAECEALSINDLSEYGISIYPNPTNGTINFDLDEKNIYQIRILDCTGKTVFEKTDTEQTNALNISHLESGVYIISIKSNKEIYKRKILKE